MAVLESVSGKISIKDGAEIKEACEDWEITFGCYEGVCGLCQIQVLEGKENLNPLTEAEEKLGMKEEKRLACQCKINQGRVKISRL